MAGRLPTPLPLLLLLCASARLVVCQYGWALSDELNTDSDPWTPCEKKHHGVLIRRGMCRVNCVAKWSYAPENMDCQMLPTDKLLARAHSRGLEQFQKMSQDSFSKVNSGVSSLGEADPDTG